MGAQGREGRRTDSSSPGPGQSSAAVSMGRDRSGRWAAGGGGVIAGGWAQRSTREQGNGVHPPSPQQAPPPPHTNHPSQTSVFPAAPTPPPPLYRHLLAARRASTPSQTDHDCHVPPPPSTPPTSNISLPSCLNSISRPLNWSESFTRLPFSRNLMAARTCRVWGRWVGRAGGGGQQGHPGRAGAAPRRVWIRKQGQTHYYQQERPPTSDGTIVGWCPP